MFSDLAFVPCKPHMKTVISLQLFFCCQTDSFSHPDVLDSSSEIGSSEDRVPY